MRICKRGHTARHCGHDGSPRPEAISAIADCLQAGIRVKMITGDHPQTAMSIGQMLGIGNAASAITGRELEAMDDHQLSEAAQNTISLPEPARKINSAVQALQSKQEVVGMTGDGERCACAEAGGCRHRDGDQRY